MAGATTRALGPVGSWALRLLAGTMRIQRDERAVAPLWAARTPAIYVVWHARLLLLPYLYRHRGLHVLISRSQDGEMVAGLVRRFGFTVVRGSSSRGGAYGLRALARALANGHSVVVVPDGPRGPSESVKAGVVALARLSGAPVVPVALAASAEWRTRSWDSFRVPKPFARCLVRFGDPLHVAPQAGRAADESARKEIEGALREVTWRADEEVRR
ncbi:MAG TPA: lysophospholipid acyltransferase family protein [Candidatus Bathyarchaeia archaeon]|nr:lysophospholipid acyltransferase family protein [Candidatus Bathyarchaeia archaeon]